MNQIIYGILTITILSAVLILRNISPKIFLHGALSVKNWKEDLFEEYLKDLLKIAKYYRWIGIVYTIILVGTFLSLLIITEISKNLMISSILFETGLFSLIVIIFKRVDKYEKLVYDYYSNGKE